MVDCLTISFVINFFCVEESIELNGTIIVLENNCLFVFCFLEMITSRSTLFFFAVSVLFVSIFPPIVNGLT